MKNVILLSLILVSFAGFSQEINQNKVYSSTKVDIKPQYKGGGEEELIKFISDNFKSLQSDKLELIKVPVTIFIDENGEITKVAPYLLVDDYSKNELERVIKSSLGFTPGKIGDTNVKVSYLLKVSINAEHRTAPIIVGESDITKTPAQYPDGGDKGFLTYVMKNFAPPDTVESISGRVVINFVVETDGSLSDIKVLRGLTNDIDERLVKIIEKSKKWKPAIQKGEAVRVQYTLPIHINIEN